MAETTTSSSTLPRPPRFGRILLMAGILVGLMALTLLGLRQSQHWVAHTHEVIENLQRLLIAIEEAENEQRLFLLTGDDRYRTAHAQASGRAFSELDHLRFLTRDNARQQIFVASLRPVIRERLEFLHKGADLRRQIGLRDPVRLLSNGVGPQRMEEIRAQLDYMADEENRLLALRQTRLRTRLLILGGIAGFLLVLVAFVLLRWWREMSDRLETDEALIKQTRVLRSILDSLGEGVIVVDREGRYVHYNPEAERLLQAAARELTPNEWPAREGVYAADGITPLRRENSPLQQALSGHSSDNEQFLIRNAAHPEGMWISASSRPVHASSGELYGAVVAFRDITGQKRSMHELEGRVRERTSELEQRKAELTELTQHLESRVEERTHELAQTQEALYRSQKLEAIGRLAGGIAHDFNNLMTGIRGICAEALESFEASDSRRADMEDVLKASDRATALTRQLLAFSRQQITLPRILNLNVILEEMHGLLRRLIGEDIKLSTFLAPDLWHVRVDPGQIEQILVNLALNSRDAMPDGGQITIETSNVVLDQEYAKRHFEIRPGRHILLTVSDTGSGIAENVQPHIFEPFFTTKSKDKGSGLGLSTVYGIVKQSGGDIFVYSSPKAGTSFKIYLPAVVEEGAPEAGPSAAPGKGKQGTETVLVVEDEPIVRRVTVKSLVRQGYTVLEAEDGKSALEVCASYTSPIDLLLTDVIMPGMNGRQLAEMLQALRPKIKVLYMSGFTQNIIVERGVLKPGIAFIEKSFTSQMLASKVREVLDARK